MINTATAAFTLDPSLRCPTAGQSSCTWWPTNANDTAALTALYSSATAGSFDNWLAATSLGPCGTAALVAGTYPAAWDTLAPTWEGIECELFDEATGSFYDPTESESIPWDSASLEMRVSTVRTVEYGSGFAGTLPTEIGLLRPNKLSRTAMRSGTLHEIGQWANSLTELWIAQSGRRSNPSPISGRCLPLSSSHGWQAFVSATRIR